MEVDGEVAATGGILFHYNRPYDDIYMDVAEPLIGSACEQPADHCMEPALPAVL